jgi:hypothetical protein
MARFVMLLASGVLGAGSLSWLPGAGIVRRFTMLTAVLLSSSMLAAAAAAATQSQSPVCQQLAQRVEQCQRGTARLGNEMRASCDRINEGFRAACGPLETIGASALVGGALNLLRQDYLVVPIEKTAAGVFPSHVVIGPADLADPHVIALLRRAYRVGKTVAIAGATQDEVRRFHRLLRPGQEPNCGPLKGQTKIELYGLQRSQYRTPPQNSSYCLVNLDKRAEATDRRWLRERFGPTPPQPAAGKVTTTDDSTQFLTGLATATLCSYKGGAEAAGNVESDLYVYGMRDFSDTGCSTCKDPGADYYLFQDNVTFSQSQSGLTYIVAVGGSPEEQNGGVIKPLIAGLLGLEFADPQTTTTYESSYTNSQSTTVSASVGVNADGPNVTYGYSVTSGQSQTYNVPPTTILNQSNLATALPFWQFTPESFPAGADFSVNTTWTWHVPQDAYPLGGSGPSSLGPYGSGEIVLVPYTAYFCTDPLGGTDQCVVPPGADTRCWVPYPFSAWTVNPPQLSSLEPASTEINGGQFTITGQYLYPSSVTAVLIGGTAVPLSTNVDLVDENTITVTVPGSYRIGNYQVQVNTQFNGQNRFSNTLDLTLTD